MLKTQGRRGEVAVATHTDVPDRFSAGMQLWALGEDGTRRRVRIEDLWPHQRALVMKFAGVDSISDAEALVGCELQVPIAERAKLDAGWAYVSDLVGCVVFDADREIGAIKDVQFGAGEAPLLVVGDKNYEIPFAEAHLKSVDLEHKRIVMELPDGMLELNAPLTAEEKERMK